MPIANPLKLFSADRGRARNAQDPTANVCTVANVDEHGGVQLRTLVLREVDDQLAIFVNATSPKWPSVQAGFALLTFWPSINLQYRMQVEVEPVEPGIVRDSWLLRPDAPKRMDWFYQQHSAQSSVIVSRETLLEKLSAVDLPDPMQAPDAARGLLLKPLLVERLDLAQANGVHDRQLFERTTHGWRQSTLVP